MQGRKGYIVLLLLALVMAGCKTNEPSQTVGMPISICLSASEIHTANHAMRRAIGDPGTTECFLFPHHLYFIVVRKTGETTWALWTQEHRTLTDGDWIPGRYEWNLPTEGDSIYRYDAEITMLLTSSDKFVGHVYAIASAEELTFNKPLSEITGLDDLLNLSFNTSSEAIQKNLQHIYSSPYNLKVDGAYYGSFDSEHQRVPHVDLLLYHVAAKVDIQWNVVDTMRINKTDPSKAVRLTYMEARNLFNGNAYCFKPMRNELAALPGTGYTRANIVRPTDEGLWWEGRSYFYTIPYVVTDAAVGDKVYFPLQMRMETNSSGNYYLPTLNLKVDTTAVFVPWLRAMFNINKPLTAGADTKTIDY
jgi:hypothetical protein